MTMTDPNLPQAPEPTPEAEATPRKRKSKTADAAINTVDATTTDAVEPEKPKRRRKTKAEKEAARMARAKVDAEKPLDPKLWFTMGAILLVIAGFIYIDPVTFAEAGQSHSEGMWIRDLLVIVVAILGKNPTVILLAVIGLLSLGMGIWGWVDARKPKPEKTSGELPITSDE
ncbi:MAG: hypothetical protein K8I30_05680 [Anaerolineae bacterium]|nr:hypothetical protein [Anaerolineae bacterium]